MKSIILNLLFISLLYILCFISCGEPNAFDNMKNMGLLQGEWSSHRGVAYNENWDIISDSVFYGFGFSLNDADTLFKQDMRIFRDTNRIYYSIDHKKDSNNIKFELMEATKNSWLFKNLKNSYPNIVLYNLSNDTTLNIEISDMDGNKKQLFFLTLRNRN
jgi:hypothetical protein